MQKYQEAVVNTTTGKPISGASVTVKTLLGVTATIYSGNGSPTTANPLTTDDLGRFSFYAADGRYTLSITGPGISGTTTITDILLEDPADGSSALAASGGAALIGFTQSGTGATSTDLQTKVRELPATPIDTAAPSDGTDGTTKLNNLFTRSNVLIAPNAYTTTLGGVNFQYKVEGSPSASLVGTNAAASYDFAVTRAGAVLRDLNLTGVSTVQALCSVGSSITDVVIDGINVTTAAAIAVAINTALAARWKVVNSTLNGNNYAYLLNDNTTGTGFIVGGNFLTSTNGDAVEINSPTNNVQDGAIYGNYLKAANNGAAVNAGFAIGIAAGRNWSFFGNFIPQSRQEAIHVEDSVRTLAFVGNVGRDLKKNGVHLLPDSKGTARGTVVVGQNFEADSASSGFTGLANLTSAGPGAKSVTSITRVGQLATVTTAAAHGLYSGMSTTIGGATQTEYNIATTVAVTGPTTFTYSVNGSPATPATGTITSTGGTVFTPAHVLIGNRVRDFDLGADCAGGYTILNGNVFEEATTAGISASSGVIIGENLLSSQVGVPAALVTFSGDGGTYGKVYSDKTPTAVMTRTSTGLPGVLKGVCCPGTAYAHAGGSQNIPVITLPNYARGRITVKVRQISGDSSFMSADIQWDGTTLITDNLIARDVGACASSPFTQTAGILYFPLFKAAAAVFQLPTVDFTGEWTVY